ncbi:probable 3-ketoacyl-CoA synthase 21 [Vigna radiata var. radiata]|uniref:3-ketoacyl-CoA synthase n=1 Tax=Vigna radiata var. radiata TaxID=3916 RepID=A0A1S3TYX8_VIGRR|nr:probable 3-ketoacyl-CoA synthase 21 [Vigna radiata var. radiata]
MEPRSLCCSLEILTQHMNTVTELIISPCHCLAVLLVACVATLYAACRRKTPIYLIDFNCYCPPSSYRLPLAMFEENQFYDDMDPEAVAFQCKIMAKSGFSELTSISPSLAQIPKIKALSFALEEAETIMCSVIKNLFEKNKINPKTIDILITNSSVFCPTPSLSAMVVNRFRMRSNIMSFNLSGMGCSAGIISMSLAKDLLRVHRNSLALIVSTETLSLNWYTGKVPSMLLSNCLFRMGGAAILMSSRVQDRHKAKYKLQHIVRTITAQDDESHGCVYQQVDPEEKEGVSISKSIVNVSGDALKKNIASLGPLVLPLREQFLYLFSIICRKMWSTGRISIYTPNFNHAFEHFCIHSGGRAIIQAVERNLRLRKQDVEPSSMTLYRFGNISSSSIWYELSYIEAKGRMKCGDRVWQIAFGSGFKCNSAVWKCVCDMKPDTSTAWRDTIHSYPVDNIMRTN